MTAHATFWSRKHLNSVGWVALEPLALACVAHDRGLSFEVVSDYMPRTLIRREFSVTADASNESGAAEKAKEAGLAVAREAREKAAAVTRELALRAGVAFGRTQLLPEGYVEVPVAGKPFERFDFVFVKEPDQFVVVDTLAGDETLGQFRGADGTPVQQGSRMFTLAVIENMRSRHPDLAARLLDAVNGKTLRYFEIRQTIAPSGTLGKIELRQFSNG